ncbi:uncharacterized protein [Emydura macquarii macquarii]|uniref:uncharacterized protein n=1 Tax=Emydura macquarii macquarii TaxID=1129001 RepID=UPI00352A8BA6
MVEKEYERDTQVCCAKIKELKQASQKARELPSAGPAEKFVNAPQDVPGILQTFLGRAALFLLPLKETLLHQTAITSAGTKAAPRCALEAAFYTFVEHFCQMRRIRSKEATFREVLQSSDAADSKQRHGGRQTKNSEGIAKRGNGQEQMIKMMEDQTDAEVPDSTAVGTHPYSTHPAVHTEQCAMPSLKSSHTFLACSQPLTVLLALHP